MHSSSKLAATIWRRASLLIAIAGLCICGSSVADEVTAEGLLKTIPILSPENEALQSFRFTASTPLPTGGISRFSVCWSRPDNYGLVVLDPLGTPVLFLAQEQMLIYDASRGTITLNDSLRPNAVLQCNDRKIAANFGFTGKDKASVVIDLPSLLADVRGEPELRRINANNWETSQFSGSGKSVIVSQFESSQAWPLRNMTIRDAKNGEVQLSISQISINQPIPKTWMTFPDLKRLPREVRVIRMSDIEVKTAADGVAGATLLMRALAAPSAIRDRELQKVALWDDVDWAEAARSHERITPLFAKFLVDHLTAPQSTSAPEKRGVQVEGKRTQPQRSD